MGGKQSTETKCLAPCGSKNVPAKPAAGSGPAKKAADDAKGSGARQATRMKSKFVISNAAKEEEEGKPEEHLEEHIDERAKMDDATKELVMKGLQADPLCATLKEEDINIVMQSMHAFNFKAHDAIVKQGETGTTIFVVQEGTLSVSVNGVQTNTLTSGMPFGGVALMYKCPRTATIVATTPTKCWGANGDAFHKIVRANAQKQYKENRGILDRIPLLEGLSAKQKDIIAEGVFAEHCEVDRNVAIQGQLMSAVYFVKSGSIVAYKGGSVGADNKLVGGTEAARYAVGSLLGEQALFNDTPATHTYITADKCELLCISTKNLKETLGENVGVALQQTFLATGIKKSPSISQFTPEQQKRMVNAMAVRDAKAGEKIPDGLRIAIVVQGDVVGVRKGQQVSLARGHFYEQEGAEDEARLTNVVAGRQGCKIAMLDKASFATALREMNLVTHKKTGDDNDGASEYEQKMMVIKKVHVFRALSHDQTECLVKAFRLKDYAKGDFVIKQGETGTEFYVVASGEVQASITENNAKKVLRTMGKNYTFGERSLLFSEPRSASVEVISAKAQLWSIDGEAFSTIVRGQMKDALVDRINLQDTSVTLKDLKHVKCIGAGATGTVRLVQHKTTKQRYALKRVKKNKRGKIPKEVEGERALLAENDHPFIMHMVKHFETPKSVYMLLELNTGGELHAAIRKLPAFLPLAMAQFYTGSLALVLEELSDRNIVYRDLKPENVMLDMQGYLKLVDFGIAKKLDENNPQTFTIIGTPHYMAPEVLLGRGYGLEVDIWTLGIMMYEFVCGRLPFADDREDPSEVCQAVLKATLKFPSQYRDNNGRELIKGLLCRQRKKRVGAGINGFEDIKKSDFFKDKVDGNIFEKILGRELTAPYTPKGETYCDPQDILDVTLSDAGELG